MKTYNVSRYFDDHLEAVVSHGLTQEAAQNKASELNNAKPRAYVVYIVRQDSFMDSEPLNH